MRARATRQGDVWLGRQPKALFPGQVYDLPDEVVKEADWLEPVDVEEPDGSDAEPARRRRRG